MSCFVVWQVVPDEIKVVPVNIYPRDHHFLCTLGFIYVMFSVITEYGFRVLGLELFPMFESKNRS